MEIFIPDILKILKSIITISRRRMVWGNGYKASGHENVKIYSNIFENVGEFSLESAHEHEYGFQIYDNTLNRCISIPKSDGGANPADRGYDYAIWIHHNRLSDSYDHRRPP